MNAKQQNLFEKACYDLANDCKALGTTLKHKKLNRDEFLERLAIMGNKFLDTFEEINKSE